MIKLDVTFLQSVLNSFEDAIKIVDREKNIFFANNAAIQMANCDKEKIKKRRIDHSCFGNEGIIANSSLYNVFKGVSVSPIEYIFKTTDGVKHFYELSFQPIGNGNDIEYVIMRSRDVSQRRILERDMFHREKFATLGQVATSIAHEIRNPITGIRLGIDVLHSLIENSDSDEIFEGLTNDIHRLDQILQQLLDYSKVRRKKKEKISVNKEIKKSLILLSKEAEKNNISIHFQFSEIIPEVFVDKTEFQQIIFNIVLNSIQAMKTEGKIVLKTTNVNVNDTLGVLIEIEDNGSGIKEKDMFKIYNLYFTTKENGSGLGLPMAQKIMQENGGSLVLESKENKGTIAKLFFPIEIS
jgi:PAS domain S-box-containing protein